MDLNIFTLILLGILLLAFIALAYFLITIQRKTAYQIDELKKSQDENKSLELMQNQIGQLTKNINQQLQNMSGQFRDTTGHIGSTLGDVKKDLGKMEVITREVLEKSKDISNLENLLRAPNFRGGLGELFLGDLLAQILPPAHFSLQHKFKSSEIVDAIVKLGGSIVPIDAKFPLDNFRKYLNEEEPKTKQELRKKFVTDVKKHIQNIAQKYILPDEGTFDFALMYIPAENIYYESILKDEDPEADRSIFSYAIKKKVIPVSPNSFFAYLQVIVLGLKGMQIEKSAKTIYQSLSRLQGDLTRFRTNFQLIGTHLGNARTKFDEADKRLDKFSDKLTQVGGHEVVQLPETDTEGEDQT